MTAEAAAAAKVTVARTVDEVEALRGVWDALPGGLVTSDVDYFLTVLDADGAAPYVLLLERDGEPHALAAGRLEHVGLRTRFGYRNVYDPSVRALTTSYGGLLGDDSPETAGLLFDRLRAALAEEHADVLRLRSLRVGSPLHEIATRSPSFATRQHVSARKVHWRLALPGSFEEFLASLSSRTREGVRRYARKLEREYGDRLSLERLNGEADLERFFAQARTVAEKTYQHGLGVAVTDDPTLRRLIELAAQRGWFRSWLLSLDGEPAAFWHGMAYRGVFSIGVPGYDPAYAHLRIGNYVLGKAIEDLCAEPGIETLDFGFGDAEYKRRFGTEQWDEEDVLVYAPSFRGVRINLIRTAVLKSAATARRVTERAPALGDLRRRWRSRL